MQGVSYRWLRAMSVRREYMTKKGHIVQGNVPELLSRLMATD
jgi:hypothetical protein